MRRAPSGSGYLFTRRRGGAGGFTCLLFVSATLRLRVPMLHPFNLLSLVGLLVAPVPWTSAVAQGSGWELLKAETTASFRGLSVVSDRVIWASGTRGTVIRSTDGGTTWTVDSIPNAAAFDLRGLRG